MTSPIVAIEQGALKGTEEKDWQGGTFYTFSGVPYAKPPLGPLRFKVSKITKQSRN